MRKVATVVLPGLVVIGLGAVLWAGQVTAQSSMNSNTSEFAAPAAASLASPQLNAGSELAGSIGSARQVMSASVPEGVGTARESHALGAMVSKPDPTAGADIPGGSYSANMSATLAPAGVSGTTDAPPAATDVPTGLRLSATANAAASALGGGIDSGGRSLGK